MEKTAGMIDPDLLLHRITMVGKFENKDIIAPIVARKRSSPGYRFGQLLPLVPLFLGLGWIVDRRNTIRANDPTPAARR